MMRSMFSGVAGLRNHQLRMDVIGNNIANVNTVGYKRSKLTFQDMLSQNLRGASSPQGGRGGTNPQQVGLGVTVGAIDTIHTQGSSETTGKTTDMMVNGDGFFVVADGSNQFYTRAGNFDFDTAGNFINVNGLKVMGWTADPVTGDIDTAQALGGITVSKGIATAKATTQTEFTGNLDANTATYAAADPTTWVNTSAVVYDSLGNAHTVNLEIRKAAAANTWNVALAAAVAPATNPTGMAPITFTAGTLVFKADGSYDAAASTAPMLEGTPGNALPFDASATPDTSIKIDFSKMTQFGIDSDVKLNYQDGATAGSLTGFSIDKSGIITGQFSSGLTKQLAQIAVANFNNPGGLTKSGSNLYQVTNNSGNAQIGTAGNGGRGDITPGALEMSNVDLSQEFTDMIITQRGFQANSRIITTSDEMLQELVNLKR